MRGRQGSATRRLRLSIQSQFHMTFLYFFAMGLTVVANVPYHFCQKAISPNANPLVSLFFTYLSGMLITLVCIPLFYPGLHIGPAVKGLNWATVCAGFGIFGVATGFL